MQIKAGISDGIVTEVVDGLKEGDRVITAEPYRGCVLSIAAGKSV